MTIIEKLEALQNVMVRLHMTDSYALPEKTQIPGSILDFPLTLSVHETVSLMPKLSKATLQRIAKGAEEGSLDDMLTLSMLYSVGFGLPDSPIHAATWASFSITAPGPLEYDRAVSDLNKHVKVLGKANYPKVIDQIYRSLLPNYRRVERNDVPADSYLISPLLAGVRLYAIYRVKEVEGRTLSYLYDVRCGGVDGDHVCLELASKLNIPLYLGSHGNKGPDKRLVWPDYATDIAEYCAGPPEFFVVSGTLVVNAENKRLVKRNLPHIKSVSMLFDHFLDTASDPRKPIRDKPSYVDCSNKIEALQETLKSVRRGEELDQLREQFESLRKRHAQAKRKEDFDKSATLKARSKEIQKFAARIKEGTAQTYLEGQIEELKSELKAMSEENKMYRAQQSAKYPENFFEFIASDIYSGKNSKSVRHIALGQNMNAHLSALGFQTDGLQMFDRYVSLRVTKKNLTSKKLRSLLEKFAEDFSDYAVTGLVLRPVDMGSVNKAQKLPVYVVTSHAR